MRPTVKKANFISTLVISTLAMLIPYSVYAGDLEITPYIGQMYSADLVAGSDSTDLSVNDASHYGFSIAWRDSPNGQGQILLNTVSHDFVSSADSQLHSFDVTYAHFNGVAQFRQRHYVTTVSLGLGGAYFDTDDKNELYPSFTLAFGTRYELSKNFALVTEIRGYASYIEDDNQLFCEGETCHALLEESVWLETSISAGFAFSF